MTIKLIALFKSLETYETLGEVIYKESQDVAFIEAYQRHAINKPTHEALQTMKRQVERLNGNQTCYILYVIRKD